VQQWAESLPARYMGLPETFESIRSSIVAFISRVTITNDPQASLPVFPSIIGTGFFVDISGVAVTNRHVIDILEEMGRLPRHPETGGAAVGALVFTEIESNNGEQVLGMLNVDLLGWQALEHFTAGPRWYGQAVPDLGFVQLNVRDVPVLRLATEANILRVGTAIATAGFPEGTGPVTFHEKITQLTPVLRHGIISSVFPFAGPKPHGFSIDVLLQGGASGSPVFLTDQPTVVGMIASQIKNTNYTVCVPSNLLSAAFGSVREKWPPFAEVPTLSDLIAAGKQPADEMLNWDRFTVVPPSATD
jgi:S1-C subfamily serine protease